MGTEAKTMSSGEDSNSSYEDPSPAHHLSFSSKKRKMYSTQHQSIIKPRPEQE